LPALKCLEDPWHYLTPGPLLYALGRWQPVLLDTEAFRSLVWPGVAAALKDFAAGNPAALATLIMNLPQLLECKEVRAAMIHDLDRRDFRLLRTLWESRRRRPRARETVELHRQVSVLRGADAVGAAPWPCYVLRDGKYESRDACDKEDQRIIRVAQGAGATSEEIADKKGTYNRVKSAVRQIDPVSVLVPAALVPCAKHVGSKAPEPVEAPHSVWSTGALPRVPTLEEAKAAEVLLLKVASRDRGVVYPEGVHRVTVPAGEAWIVWPAPAGGREIVEGVLQTGAWFLGGGLWEVIVQDGKIQSINQAKLQG